MLSTTAKVISGQLFFRRTDHTKTARTESAAMTILALRRELERLRAEQHQHEQAAQSVQEAIRRAIANGQGAATHRTEYARLKAAVAALEADADRVIDLIEDVRGAATKHTASPIALQIEAAVNADLERFQLPPEH